LAKNLANLELLRPFNFWQPGERAARGISRSYYLSSLQSFTKTDALIVVSGQRRSGKSYILRQYIDILTAQGVPPEDILYLNFFLDDLSPLKSGKEFKRVLAAWETEVASHGQKRRYLIIDEVTELEGWQQLVASLLEHPKKSYKVVIAGSNSQVLSDDLPNELRGRYYLLHVFPFGFDEFCTARGLSPDQPTAFAEYLEVGGMPEAVLAPDIHARANLLTQIRHSTVKKDVIDRYQADTDLVDRIVNYSRQTYGTQLSIKRVTEQLKGAGARTTEATVRDHLQWLQNVYWIDRAAVYSARTSDLLRKAEHKYYLGDHGFAYDARNNLGRLLENVIYNELRRAQFEVQTYHGYHQGKSFEIDFMATRGQRVLFVQVAWNIGDPMLDNTAYLREFGNFSKLGRHEGEKLVVTVDTRRYDAAGILHLQPHDFIRHLHL